MQARHSQPLTVDCPRCEAEAGVACPDRSHFVLSSCRARYEAAATQWAREARERGRKYRQRELDRWYRRATGRACRECGRPYGQGGRGG